MREIQISANLFSNRLEVSNLTVLINQIGKFIHKQFNSMEMLMTWLIK